MSFEESVFGGQREIEISCYEACDSCDGTGAKSSDNIKSCSSCGGRGGVIKTQKTPFGVMSQVIWHNDMFRTSSIVSKFFQPVVC